MISPSQHIRLQSMRRIVVFRALYLGDMLCAVPALRALRQATPHAHITLAGLSWAKEFAARFSSYVDSFVEFPGFPGLPEQEFDGRQVVAFLSHLQRAKLDLAIQMHGSGAHANSIIALMGAKRTAGFYVPGQYCPDQTAFIPYPDQGHEIRRHLLLIESLGACSLGDRLEFPLSPKDYRQLESLDGAHSLRTSGYVCIHVGAKLPSRRWPIDRFAAVADALGGDGYQLVLTGNSSETELVASVESALREPCVNLCGQTDLGALAALLSRAALLISNDTGVAHVAAAVRTPSVVVVLASDSNRWAPLDRRRHRVVMQPVACRPCEHIECPIGFGCAEQVTVRDVLTAAREQLAKWSAAPRRPIRRLAVATPCRATPCGVSTE